MGTHVSEPKHGQVLRKTAFEEYVQKYRKEEEAVGVFDEQESAAILELMRRILAFRPEERPTTEEILKSEWTVRWVLPEVGQHV